ncbi:MAG: NAD-binding protein [Alphaproteobacteria bacterium]|nr:NAD-binding protein [Alphaproteobacteria bacterium]
MPVAVVLAGTLLAFAAGTGASERPGIPEASLLVQLYYATGLFVLGGLDLGTPTGGPRWAHDLLWACYFMGPAITTTAVVEGAIRLSRPAWLTLWFERDHVVVVGDSPVARLYAQAARASEPHRHVLELPDPDDVPAHVERARAVVIASEDDLANLGLAWKLRTAWPNLPISAHTGRLGLRRSAEALADTAHVRVFNAFEITADAIFHSVLAPHLQRTAGRDAVGILGFGRMGQTVLRHLQERARDEVEHVVVVDRHASTGLRQFAEHAHPDPTTRLEALDADILDPATWDSLAVHLHTSRETPLIVVTTDDDTTNLLAAVGLRARLPDARIFVRIGYSSAFVKEVEARVGISAVPVDALLREALRAHYEARDG